MKELEKQYNKNVKNPANFSIHRPSYMAGGRAALEWVAKRGMHHYGNDFLTDMNELSTEIQIELGMLDEHGKVIKSSI